MGLRPFRAFFLPRSRGASRRSMPSCRFHRQPVSPPSRTPSRAEPWFVRAGPSGRAARAGMLRLQGFAPLGSPQPSGSGLGRRRLAALLGFCLSRDFASVSGPTVDTGQLPWAWHAVPSSDTRSLARSVVPPCGVFRHESAAVLSRGRPPLLRFPTLSRHSAVRKQRGPRYVFTSGPEPRHRAPSDPLWTVTACRPRPSRQDVDPCSLPQPVE
jgi:hypothetical protein